MAYVLKGKSEGMGSEKIAKFCQAKFQIATVSDFLADVSGDDDNEEQGKSNN